MFEDKRILTAKEILDKEFKIDARGYRPHFQTILLKIMFILKILQRN